MHALLVCAGAVSSGPEGKVAAQTVAVVGASAGGGQGEEGKAKTAEDYEAMRYVPTVTDN